jgi:hypothetical protein
LKQVTATVTPNGHSPAGLIQITVIYSDADNNGGGLIKLWREQTKVNSIPLTHTGNGVYTGTLPTYPTCTFYVEGIRPSKQANDVKLNVQAHFMQMGQPPLTVVDEELLTVTPVMAEFSVTPRDPAQVMGDTTQITFLRNLQGQIVGLNSGSQSGPGGDPGGNDGNLNRIGASFTADLNPRTNVAGQPQFLQTMTIVTNGDPFGAFINGGVGNLDMRLAGGETFPILDTSLAQKPFYWPSGSIRFPDTADRVRLTSKDTPFLAEKETFNTSAWAGLIDTMEVTYDLRLFLVWEFADSTIYTLGKVDWRVVFYAFTPMGGALEISSDSVITANPAIRTYADPDRVIGSTYGEKFEWAAP